MIVQFPRQVLALFLLRADELLRQLAHSPLGLERGQLPVADLGDALEVVDVDFIDHLIIGAHRYLSMKDMGAV